MKFGYNMFPLMDMGPAAIVRVARATEELGYESIWMPDHFVFPPEIPPTYPFSEDGVSPWAPDTHLYEPFVLLSHLAATTSSLRLGVHVLLLPLRDTLTTARAVATLDQFSGGRAMLGAGLGWLKDEYDIAGRDWRTRGASLNEQFQAIKVLWTEEVPEFRGRHVSIGPCRFEPKPHQQPHPPILVGGVNPPALKRAAQLADGWMGVNHSLEETQAITAELRRLLHEAGRDADAFEVSVMGFNPSVDDVKRFEQAGVHRLLVHLVRGGARTTEASFVEALARFATDVASKA